MSWKVWFLPTVSILVWIINVSVLVTKLTQPGQGPILGQVLITLFWTAMAWFSFRGLFDRKKKKDEEDWEA